MPEADQLGLAGAPPSSPTVENGVRLKAKRYQAMRLRLLPVRLLAGIAFPLLLLAGPSQWLSARLGANLGAWPLVAAGYFIIISIAYTLWLLPLNYYQGHVVEQRFGLSTETPGSWLKDWVKGLVVSIVIGLPIVIVVYGLLRTMPQWWWLAAAVVVTVFGIVLANLAPVLIYPLFFRFEPLADDVVRDRLSALADKSHTPFSGIFRMELSVKSNEAEALLTGMGRTRRIVLSDTLLDNYELDEIEVILAHELGHHALRHLPMLIVSQALGAFVGLFVISIVLRLSVGHLGLGSIADVANLPLMIVVLNVLQAISTPLGNAWSRRLEARADAFALELTLKPQSFVKAMSKLADQNLADIDPNSVVELLLYGHPAIGRRLAAARRFERERGLEPASEYGV